VGPIWKGKTNLLPHWKGKSMQHKVRDSHSSHMLLWTFTFCFHGEIKIISNITGSEEKKPGETKMGLFSCRKRHVVFFPLSRTILCMQTLWWETCKSRRTEKRLTGQGFTAASTYSFGLAEVSPSPDYCLWAHVSPWEPGQSWCSLRRVTQWLQQQYGFPPFTPDYKYSVLVANWTKQKFIFHWPPTSKYSSDI